MHKSQGRTGSFIHSSQPTGLTYSFSPSKSGSPFSLREYPMSTAETTPVIRSQMVRHTNPTPTGFQFLLSFNTMALCAISLILHNYATDFIKCQVFRVIFV